MRAALFIALVSSLASAQSTHPVRSGGHNPTGAAAGLQYLEPSRWWSGQSGSTSSGPSCPTCTNGLVAYWSFNNSNANDPVGGFNATSTSVTYSAGNGLVGVGAGSASGSKITLPNPGPQQPNNVTWTYALWIKNATAVIWGALFVQTTGLGIFVNKPAASSFIYWYGTGSADTTVIAAGTWTFVVAEYSTQSPGNVTVAYYINGALSTTQTGAAVAGLSWTSATMLNDSGGEQFTGSMDEVGIWNRALTSTEISQLYNSGTGLTYPF